MSVFHGIKYLIWSFAPFSASHKLEIALGVSRISLKSQDSAREWLASARKIFYKCISIFVSPISMFCLSMRFALIRHNYQG